MTPPPLRATQLVARVCRSAIVDDFTRECLAALVDTSLSGARVVRELKKVIACRGRPCMIVSDNGTKLVSRAILGFCEDTAIEWHDIAPGKPMQHALGESFNGRLRDGCLDAHAFSSLVEARRIIEAWRIDDNTIRPHTSRGGLSPAMFASRSLGKADGNILRTRNKQCTSSSVPLSLFSPCARPGARR